MLTSSALVLMMTGPGLALFYCGLVRSEVYEVIAYSTLLVPSNRLLRVWIERLITKIEARLNG